jgi:hypothetical protein
MALQKQNYSMNFAKGLDLKTDPNQVPMGKFLQLNNTVFKNGGGLTKRNGFGDLTVLPDADSTTLTTLNDNLVATGASLQAYSSNTNTWVNRGTLQPVDLVVQPIARAGASQTACDTVVATNNLACTAYIESGSCYYQINDINTGQIIVSKQLVATLGANPRCFVLGNNFIVTFIGTIIATPHLQMVAIPITTPTSPTAVMDISTNVKSSSTGYDGYVSQNRLYIAWNASAAAGVQLAIVTTNFNVSTPLAYSSYVGDVIRVCVDSSGSSDVAYVAFWNSTTKNGHYFSANPNLAPILLPTQFITGKDISHLTGLANNGIINYYYDVINTYPTSSVRSDYIEHIQVDSAGAIGSPSVFIRSVGLAAQLVTDSAGNNYLLTAWGSQFQPTYFLLDSNAKVVMKLAYSNGGGYITTKSLPGITLFGSTLYIPYLFRDQLVPANKSQGLTGNATGGIYSQTGVNIAALTINTNAQYSAEIANALHLTGGFLWEYDAVLPVEHSFHLWPEDLQISTATGSGSLTAQQYYYIFCYEWTDAQGNLQRSAPSLPAGIVTTTASSTNTLKVPTLRLTYKNAQNPVKLVGYRWSTAQQTYYQFTSIQNPYLNDPTVDTITVVDTQADSAILGNSILYTTGGVVENIAAPACAALTLYKSRLFVLNAEDRNTIWYSKQVIGGTPVEMSDLFTIYVAPTSGAQGSTGVITALSAMDDKLIIFKQDAIYYITGNGPDNTGANNDFSDPIFISSAVGCANPNSIVLMPNGLMFQSDKGIWLLGRDMSTNYIGADVEAYNSIEVASAKVIPGTNQVRFNLTNDVILMYDYYYGQWGTFNNVPAISSCLYKGLHTYLNSVGQVRQETPGVYLDGSSPVLVSFQTAWIQLTGLQGYQRVYFLYFLSTYITPYRLTVQAAYDYIKTGTQTSTLTPVNATSVWGSENLWGSGAVWGGSDDSDQKRMFLNQQKCQAIQLTVNEQYDPTKGIPAGEGLTMSGINFVIGAKSGYPRVTARQSVG